MAVNDKKSPATTGNRAATRSAARTTQRSVADEPTYQSSPFSIAAIRGGVLHGTFVKVVLGLLIAIFALGLAVNGIGGGFGNNPTGAGGRQPEPDPVAQVGSVAIPRDDYERSAQQQIDMMRQFGQETGVADRISSRQRSLQTLTDNAAQYLAAQKEGINASGADIDKEIQKEIDDEVKGQQGDNPANFRRRVEREYGSMQAFQDQMRQGFDRDKVERKLMVDKLQEKIKNSVKVTEADYKKSVTKLKLRQIRITAKPPAPGVKDVKTAQEQAATDAKARADKLVQDLKTTPTVQAFAAAAQKESEDTATKAKGGDLGWKLPSELPFSQAIKDGLQNASNNDKIVGPLQDDFTKDHYIFYIEDRKTDLPKDYAKKKDQLIKDYQTQKGNEAWTKYQDDLKKQYTPEIYSPMLAAYQLQTEKIFQAPVEEQNKLRQQALDEYTTALSYAGPADQAAIHYQMAQLYRQMNQPDKAAAALKDAVEEAPTDDNAKLELARAQREQKQDKDALANLDEISKDLDEKAKNKPAQPSMFGGNADDSVRMQLASEYDMLNKKDLAAAERKKIKPASSSPSPMGGLGAGNTFTIPAHH